MKAHQPALSTEIIAELDRLIVENRKEEEPYWQYNVGFRDGLAEVIHLVRSVRIKSGLHPTSQVLSHLIITALDEMLPKMLSSPWDCGPHDGLLFAIFAVRSVRVKRGLRQKRKLA